MSRIKRFIICGACLHRTSLSMITDVARPMLYLLIYEVLIVFFFNISLRNRILFYIFTFPMNNIRNISTLRMTTVDLPIIPP